MKIYKTQSNLNYNYDYVENYWVGGKIPVPNQSGAYHGILKQWWDTHKVNPASWLLISEKNHIKNYFETQYTSDTFNTLEYYSNTNEVDYNINLCDRNVQELDKKWDIVLCQATLEHVYDPFTAMYNMINWMNLNGILLIHTHTPGFDYHPYPRDYLRYYSDWFIDIPQHFKNVELLELFDTGNTSHIFALYRKIA